MRENGRQWSEVVSGGYTGFADFFVKNLGTFFKVFDGAGVVAAAWLGMAFTNQVICGGAGAFDVVDEDDALINRFDIMIL